MPITPTFIDPASIVERFVWIDVVSYQREVKKSMRAVINALSKAINYGTMHFNLTRQQPF